MSLLVLPLRGLAAAAAGGFAVVALAFVGASPAAAAAAPCTDGTTPPAGSTVSCGAGSITIGVPAGAVSARVDVLGAGGGAPAGVHTGGNAAEVSGVVLLPTGTAYLLVIGGAGGTATTGTGSAGGGGASAVFALDPARSLLSKLVVAGSGGGGALQGNGGDAGSPGSSDDDSAATAGTPGVSARGGAGGIAPNSGLGQQGLPGQDDVATTATVAEGGAGAGGRNPTRGGTGGGGFAGGGGGAVGRSTQPDRTATGGGGGSSFVAAVVSGVEQTVRAGTGGNQRSGPASSSGADGSVTIVFAAVIPDAPTAVVATPGSTSGSVDVSFTAPASDGGSPITGYTVTTGPGGTTTTCTGSPCTVDGLTPGSAYSFTVVATNVVGDSLPSAPGARATVPAVAPGVPTDVVATVEDGDAVVSFTAPASNGGSPITGYTVVTEPGGIPTTCVDSPCTVRGLTPGVEYTFTVIATNAAGNSPNSAPSPAIVIPPTTPAPAAQPRGTLAFTGASLLAPVSAAASMLSAGCVLAVAARRRGRGIRAERGAPRTTERRAHGIRSVR